MKVLSSAWAASPLAASAEPALNPAQPNHRMPVPRIVSGRLCGCMPSLGQPLRLPRMMHERQGRGTGVDVHHRAAGEVERTHLGDPAAAPHPVGDGRVDDEEPDADEHGVGAELEPVGGRAGDQRRRDDGEGHLEGGEEDDRDGQTRPLHRGRDPHADVLEPDEVEVPEEVVRPSERDACSPPAPTGPPGGPWRRSSASAWRGCSWPSPCRRRRTRAQGS